MIVSQKVKVGLMKLYLSTYVSLEKRNSFLKLYHVIDGYCQFINKYVHFIYFIKILFINLPVVQKCSLLQRKMCIFARK
jgi:hypothetical protein